MENISKLFVIPNSVPEARLRVFCFPYAGGSINVYLNWVEKCPRDIELVLVQPPGRGGRITEPSHETMESFIAEIMEYSDFITSKQFIFFGHSLGARVAFELSCQLYKMALPMPRALIASGSGAPHIKRTQSPTYNLPNNEFVHSLMELNGTPKEVLENAEIMDMLMPMLRCDFKIAETYRSSDVAIPLFILVLNGQEDHEVTEQKLDAWQMLSKYKIQRVTMPGDHFFIHQHTDKVLAEVLSFLEILWHSKKTNQKY